MATHNKARVIGYLVDDPKILKTDDGFRKIVIVVVGKEAIGLMIPT